MQVIEKAIKNGWGESFAVKQRIKAIQNEIKDIDPMSTETNQFNELQLLLFNENSHTGKSLLKDDIMTLAERKKLLESKLRAIKSRYLENKKIEMIDPEIIKESVKCEDIIEKKPFKDCGGRILYSSPLKMEREDTPSFWVYTGTNSWYDFSLGIGGDVIDLYMRLYGADFPTALKELSKYL